MATLFASDTFSRSRRPSTKMAPPKPGRSGLQGSLARSSRPPGDRQVPQGDTARVVHRVAGPDSAAIVRAPVAVVGPARLSSLRARGADSLLGSQVEDPCQALSVDDRLVRPVPDQLHAAVGRTDACGVLRIVVDELAGDPIGSTRDFDSDGAPLTPGPVSLLESGSQRAAPVSRRAPSVREVRVRCIADRVHPERDRKRAGGHRRHRTGSDGPRRGRRCRQGTSRRSCAERSQHPTHGQEAEASS